jgi:hypothetical protein
MLCGAEGETWRQVTAPNRVTKRLRGELDRCAAGARRDPASPRGEPMIDEAHAMTSRDGAT